MSRHYCVLRMCGSCFLRIDLLYLRVFTLLERTTTTSIEYTKHIHHRQESTNIIFTQLQLQRDRE